MLDLAELNHGDPEAQSRFLRESMLDPQTESGSWRLYRVVEPVAE